MEKSTSLSFIVDRIIAVGLFFLLAGVPLLINPFALDYWYKPKIHSVYALLIILVTAAAGKIILLQRPVPGRNNPLLIPLVGYAISGILSTIFSISPQLSIHGDVLREEGIYTIVAYSALPVVFASLVESEKQLFALIRGLLISTALISLYAIIQYLGYDPTEHFIIALRGYENRPGSTIGNPNFLGKFLVLILPLYISCYCVSKNFLEKILVLGGLLVSFSALIINFTRASWLSFAFSILVLAFLLRKKIVWSMQKELLAIGVALVCLLAIWQIQSSIKNQSVSGKPTPTVISRIAKTFDLQEGGISGRMYLWGKALELIKDRPLLGYGLDTHQLAFWKFNLDYSRRFKVFGVIDRSHNNYLDMAIAQGLLGLSAYLLIMIGFLIWLIKTLSAEQNMTHVVLYCGVIASVVGYLLNDMFIFSVVSVSPTFWSLLGLTIAMKRLT
jgi:O-antigen ligase